jgi:cell shape-determining protein MreC
LTGISRAHHSQVAKLNEELLASRTMLGRFVSLEQERLKIKESINVNFTEENITMLASRISARVQTIINAAQDAALGKLS